MPDKYIFLGYPLSPDAPNPPAIPKMELTPFMSLSRGEDANVTLIKVVTHTGTHVDAPCHVIEGGLTLTDLQPEDFVFERPAVFELPLPDATVVTPEHLAPFVAQGQAADLLLFRFGYGPVRRADGPRYSMRCPGFGVESAEFLRQNFPRMRGLGMDVPSLSCIAYLDQTMQAHQVLLGGAGRRFLVIEDMNLDQDLAGLRGVIVAPWYIQGMDGGPAMVLGRME